MGGPHRALFLHSGPGLNAGIERIWFGDSLPICWWDQPAVVGRSHSSFDQLVAAATDQLRVMADATGGPVALVAHSFGGQIAHALVREEPKLVSSITLLGCAPNPFPPIFRLCKRMLEFESSRALEDAIEDAETHLDKASFESMVLVAATHPAYPAVYFGPHSEVARDRFLELLPQVQFLNLEIFLAVMDDFRNAPVLPALEAFDGRVIILLGRYDPVLAIDEDFAAWKRIFSQVQSQVVEAGHCVHLELPPEVWWEPYQKWPLPE